MKLFFRVAAVLCALLMLFGAGFSVCAESVEADGDVGYTPEGITLNAKSALVVYLGSTAEQDSILYGHNMDEVRGPAALVRIMMGAYALKEMQDRGIDPDTATGTYTSDLFYAYVGGTGLSVANMVWNESWTLRDLLTVSMVTGAADAAVTLAAAISGTVVDFVKGMNELAAEIGCTGSSFANVTGDDSLSQYTTAHDLYLITRYAMQFPEFESYIAHSQYTVTPVSGGNNHTVITANNMMRSSTSYYYSPMVFGRMGYTDAAGWSMLSLARDSGYEYLTIVMGCDTGAQYTDTRALDRWAFNNFTYSVLLSRGQVVSHIDIELSWNRDKLNLVPARDLTSIVYNKLTEDGISKRFTIYYPVVDAPIEKGTVCGKVELFYGIDKKIGEVELVAAETADRSTLLWAWRTIKTLLTVPWFYILVGCFILLILVFSALRSPKKRH